MAIKKTKKKVARRRKRQKTKRHRLKEVGEGRTWATYEGQRVEMGVGWRQRWSDSLCTKRITFISGKPRVAPNCNQFFVFLLQPHSSLTLCLARPHSIRGPLSSVPFSSVLNWSVPAPRRAVFRSFVRSFVRPLIRSGWLALPRATGICIRDPTICISIPRDSRYRCHRRRRCQTAGTNINTNSRVYRPLYTAWHRWRVSALVTPSY